MDDGQACLDVQLRKHPWRAGEVVILPNGQGEGGRYEVFMLWGVWQLCRAPNGSGVVKSIGRVELSEEPAHGVGSQDLVAAMRS